MGAKGKLSLFARDRSIDRSIDPESLRVCLIAKKERIRTKEREKYLLKILFCFFSKIFVKEQNAHPPVLGWMVFISPFLGFYTTQTTDFDFSFLSSLFNDARLEKTKKQSINPNANRPSSPWVSPFTRVRLRFERRWRCRRIDSRRR